MALKKTKNSPIDLKKIDELEEKLKRSLADYSNLEKRLESQREVLVAIATASLVTKMIDVLDDLYLAQNHLKDPGLQISIDKFKSVLKSEGVDELDPKEEEFNPQTMDCVDVLEGKQDYVVEVRKKGYSLNGHVIRPAQVAVGREKQGKNL